MSRERPRRNDSDVVEVSSGRGAGFEPVEGSERSALGPTFDPVDTPLPPRVRERRQLGLVGATMVVVLALGALLTIVYLATSPPVDVSRPLPPIVNADDDDAAADTTELPAWPTLVPGSSGRPVRAAQLLLRANGQDVVVTGRYGSNMSQALDRFVRRAELESRTLDGSVWPYLVTPIGPRSSGERVRAMQVLLQGNGVDVQIDGAFNGSTRGAVRLFQVQNGLEGSGTVGRPTWRLLAAKARPLDSARSAGR